MIDKCRYFVYTHAKGLIFMQTKMQRWGNSQAVRIPKPILEEVFFKENDTLEIVANGGSIIISRPTKTRKRRARKSLEERYENWNGQPYELTEEDSAWLNMEPVGREVRL